MGTKFLGKDVLNRRRETLDYVYGLIRYEVRQGGDNDKRLEVLSKIYRDLLYTEDLQQVDGWQRKKKDKDDYDLALAEIEKLRVERDTLSKQLSELFVFINDNRTKKDIIEFVTKAKKVG